MLEREIEKKLIDRVRDLGGRAYKWVSPGNNGVPDRIVILPGGRIVFVELKADRGRLSALQQIQIRALKKLGCDVQVLQGPDQVQAFMDTITAEQMRRGENNE